MEMANEIMAANELLVPSVNANCQYSTRYCWEADKVKSLIRLRAELSPLFTGKRNASKYAWAVVERELNVPLPLSKIIKKWNNLLQEYKAIKMSEEPKRREWPFFTLMDVYFSEQVNDPSLRLFSSTKTLKETIDDSVFEADPAIAAAIEAATSGAFMDIEELVRRQKERANAKKFAADDFKFNDLKPMLSNSKFNSSSSSNEVAKLSKAGEELGLQQHKIKEELMRQREQEQQESLSKMKQHARQQQQQQQRFQQQQQQQQQHAHAMQQHLATPPPALHALQQHHLQQQQHHHLQQQQQLQHQQQQQLLHQPPTAPPTPPTTAQQIHLHTAQHQAQQLHLHAHQQQQQPQALSDPNTIDQYLLSWNNFHGNMCRGFHTLQKDEKMVDVTIAAGGKIFKAHKLVLSVCSPYFQQIFLENPSSHPILLMADVEAGHMAGLLDFMYSGQVNVKYEDLPVFLKVAEAMKIKGLHTEKNMDDDCKELSSTQELESTECRFDRATHSVNITGQAYGQTQLQHQPPLEASVNGVTSTCGPNTSSSNNNNNVPSMQPQNFTSFREHIKTKASIAESFMKNLSRNNNNNASSSSDNYNHLSSNNVAEARSGDNFGILQANSKKLLDSSRKLQHKYLAKRKILMHYNDELQEKRLKEMERGYGDHQDDNNNNHNNGNKSSGNGNSNINQQHGDDAAAPATAANLTTVNTPQQQHQQQQQQQQHNNFKIRLIENQRNNSEDEALNLVQNTSAHDYNAPKTDDRDRELEIELEIGNKHQTEADLHKKLLKHKFAQEESDDNNNNVHSSRMHLHNNDGPQQQQHLRKYTTDDINNNNNNSNNISSSRITELTTTDNNNNETNKNAALINAINKSLERKVLHDEDNNNNNSYSNNNNNELDLSHVSAVKNIATAEILCGLKSKVFKIKEEVDAAKEDDEEGDRHQHQLQLQLQHQHQHQQHRQQQQCRNLNEIKNVD